MTIIVWQDATIYSLFMSVNCSTCFGWYLQPSSGTHITVSTASGISVTALQPGTVLELSSKPTTLTTGCCTDTRMPDAVGTVICLPDDGWRYHPKHVEQFTDINKLYIVASCWTSIDIIHDARNLEHEISPCIFMTPLYLVWVCSLSTSQ
jgi:hypothetical protein